TVAGAPSPVPQADPANPYATPQSAWVEPVAASSGQGLKEIIPGSEPIIPTACVKRGFDLTKRQFGGIVLVGLVYFLVTIGISVVIQVIQTLIGGGLPADRGPVGMASATKAMTGAALAFYIVSQVFAQVVSIFVGLGLTRVGLNLVSGKEVSVGMLFGEGDKLLRTIGATILYGLMVGVGFLLLIVPGIYLMLRYSLYMTAIVDRDLGVMDSFSYSSSLTTNNDAASSAWDPVFPRRFGGHDRLWHRPDLRRSGRVVEHVGGLPLDAVWAWCRVGPTGHGDAATGRSISMS
ncbi:MAG TPA: hypothetical protein VF258_09330, partial [Luteolibacter sp.]